MVAQEPSASPPPSILLRGVWPKRVSIRIPALVVACYIIAAIFGGVISPYDPDAVNYDVALQGPSWPHPFGTDQHGRDVLSRVIVGSRVSLGISFAALTLTTVVGVGLGLIAGYFGGISDAVASRFADAIFAFPLVLMAVVISVMLGPSVKSAVLAIAIVPLTEFFRVSRGVVLVEREKTYVEASRALGSSWAFILSRSLLPNVRGILVTLVALGFGYAILNEAALGFLGLGAQPPTASWGTMLSEGQRYVTDAPWLTLFPGLAILIIVAALNILGDSVRDVASRAQRQV